MAPSAARPATAPASIGLVLHDFPLGGTERIALRLAGAWLDDGIAVTIFCGTAAGPLLAMVPAGARLIEAYLPIPRGTQSRARLGAAAARHFAAHPIDVCFVPGNYHWDVVPALAALPPDCRPTLVAQISSPLAMPGRGRLLQWRFERRMRRMLAGIDACIAMDAAGQAQADRILGRAVTTALPLPAIDDIAPPPLPAPGDRAILAAGRLIRAKGFDLLIEAVARLDDPAVTLTIVGSGPEADSLRHLARRRGLSERVRFPGYVPDIRPWLDAARLFVLPSRYEGYGAVIVEALAAGRAVIATDTTPAVADLADDAGMVVPAGDADALAGAIRRALAGTPPDPISLARRVERHRLAAGARAYRDVFNAARR